MYGPIGPGYKRDKHFYLTDLQLGWIDVQRLGLAVCRLALCVIGGVYVVVLPDTVTGPPKSLLSEFKRFFICRPRRHRRWTRCDRLKIVTEPRSKREIAAMDNNRSSRTRFRLAVLQELGRGWAK